VKIPGFHREHIIKTHRLLAAALLAATAAAAHAQSPSPSNDAPTHGHFGIQLGNVSLRSQGNPVGQVTLGYDFNPTWSVEAVGVVTLEFMRMGILNPGDREFNSALGARGLARLPLAERFSLVAGLGVVQLSQDEGTVDGIVTHNDATAMVSLAGMYRLGRRWSLGVEVSSFTKSHSVNEGLRAEFHF